MANPAVLQRIDLLVNEGRYREALPVAEQALSRQPGDIDLVSAVSFILFKMREYARAEYFARELVKLLPTSGHAHHNLGNTLVKMGRFEDAVMVLNRALELEPDEPQVYMALGEAMSKQHRFATAAAVLQEGLRRNPENDLLRRNFVLTLHHMGHIEETLPTMQRLAAKTPNDLEVVGAICPLMNYAPGVAPEQTRAVHARYGALVEGLAGGLALRPPGAGSPRGKDRPLRVGLISPDLREHAVAYLIENFVEYADRSVVRVNCYSPSSEDATSQRLKAGSDEWRSVRGMSFGAMADVIRNDKVDVLIDLAGHTAGHMLPLMALRPAPVQMTYTGYPNTTGLRSVDFRIVDSLTDPEGFERYGTEKLLRLDPCYMSYRPPSELPEGTPLPAGEAGPITFGSFSSLLKYNSPMLALWARVLLAVPGSRLVLMHYGLKEEAVRQDIGRRFAAAGVDLARVEARPPQFSRQGVLPAYNEIDIGLDTTPYNGGVTLAESLLMGVPFISLAGKTSAGRVGLSVLSAVGLADLCATDEEGYVAAAVGLAADRERLTGVRMGLRERLLGSCICDGPGFCRRMEKLLMEAWNQVGSGV